MNAKANSIGIVPAMIQVWCLRRMYSYFGDTTLAGEIQGVDEAGASVALARAGWSEDARPSAEPPLWVALSSPEHGASEYWETVSYLVIWLCGLIGVGLCFL